MASRRIGISRSSSLGLTEQRSIGRRPLQPDVRIRWSSTPLAGGLLGGQKVADWTAAGPTRKRWSMPLSPGRLPASPDRHVRADHELGSSCAVDERRVAPRARGRLGTSHHCEVDTEAVGIETFEEEVILRKPKQVTAAKHAPGASRFVADGPDEKQSIEKEPTSVSWVSSSSAPRATNRSPSRSPGRPKSKNLLGTRLVKSCTSPCAPAGRATSRKTSATTRTTTPDQVGSGPPLNVDRLASNDLMPPSALGREQPRSDPNGGRTSRSSNPAAHAASSSVRRSRTVVGARTAMGGSAPHP